MMMMMIVTIIIIIIIKTTIITIIITVHFIKYKLIKRLGIIVKCTLECDHVKITLSHNLAVDCRSNGKIMHIKAKRIKKNIVVKTIHSSPRSKSETDYTRDEIFYFILN